MPTPVTVTKVSPRATCEVVGGGRSADGAHRSYGEAWSATITVQVEAAPAAEGGEAAPAAEGGEAAPAADAG